MSKRRKATGNAAAKPPRIRDVYVPRPFAGLVDEIQWVALRELVPAASAPLVLKPEVVQEHGDRRVTVATVLPMALAAMVRADGTVLLGLQRHDQSGDVSRDIAAALIAALGTEPGASVPVPPVPGPGPRLQDLLVDGALDVTLHDGFEFWLADDPEQLDANVQASLERANASIYPTVALAAAPAAYWCRVPEKAHVRWVLPEEEDAALDALARLSAAGELLLGPQTRFAGMFRAHGLLVPVWDLPRDTPAADWEEPVAALAKRYADALSGGAALSPAERRAREGLRGRQVTLR